MAGRILVLDDEENYAEMLKELLLQNNYRVDMSTRPERAIDRLEEIPYDLVISDYKMPVMDGADFLKKSRELYPNLPFILVSGLMNTPELVKVANMGVTLVLKKPLDTEEFLQQVGRFSEPMTEEEKSIYASEPAQADSGGGEPVISIPTEPVFFSAMSPAAIQFIQTAWSIVSSSRKLLMVAKPGSDAELVAKDISAWRGNSDLPVASFDWSDSNEDISGKLHGILADPDQSDTIMVRLGSVSQLVQAGRIAESVVAEFGDATDSMSLIFLLETNDHPPQLSETNEDLVVLPALNERPSDLAHYARRFARMGGERFGRDNFEFTPDAIFLLLSYDWARDYKELYQTVISAVENSETGQAISVESLEKALGLTDFEAPEAGSRMRELMRKAQETLLRQQMRIDGKTTTEIAAELEIDSLLQTGDDLKNLPLIQSKLAQL